MTSVQTVNYLDKTYKVGDRIQRHIPRTADAKEFGVISAIDLREGILPCFSLLFDGMTRPVSYYSHYEFEVLTPTIQIQPLFEVGDTVKAVAFTDCFGKYHADVPNLVVSDVRRVEGASIPTYYRITARNPVTMIEGRELYFELTQAAAEVL